MNEAQVTASKVGLLLECTRPFDPTLELDPDTPGDAALYGTEFHREMHRSMNGLRKARGPAAAHVLRAWGVLSQWLWNSPWGKLHIESAEQPLATLLGPLGEITRPCKFEEEGHRYDLLPGEIGGTADLTAVTVEGFRVVVDYKTGTYEDYTDPRTPQMLTLALQTNANAVAILHSARVGIPVVYARALGSEDLDFHRRVLTKALARIGDGSMRPGTWCRWCRAKSSCPTQHGDLVLRAGELVGRVVGEALDRPPIDRGQFHMMLGELDKLARVAREQLREEVRNGAIIERPDGKILTLTTTEVESLSKASIVKTLGELRGRIEIERLQKLGCLKTYTREELRAK